ncbi:MAG: hypothetical protein JSS79_20625 [Bacteroidetes bacterium]|nr:hypothetical protein [Bacteroidota bacterium]
MTPKQIVALLTLVSLISCSQSTNNKQADNVKADSTQTGDNQAPEKEYNKLDTITYKSYEDTCTAKSVIKKSVYPNATFDKSEWKETVELKNGDDLTITSSHEDCEYYIFTFRFETSRFKADTTDINYWVVKGIQLMKEIENGLDEPIDILGGTSATENFLKEKGENQLQLKEWIQYGNTTIKNILTIERVQKLPGDRFAIELMYSGPVIKK